MIKLLKNDPREADYFLNYPRPQVGLDYRVSIGYTGFGEPLWPVEISEDGKRIGLSAVSPGE